MIWLKASSSKWSLRIISLRGKRSCVEKVDVCRTRLENVTVLQQHKHSLDLPWTLTIALRLQLAVEITEFGLEVSLVRGWSAGVGSLCA